MEGEVFGEGRDHVEGAGPTAMTPAGLMSPWRAKALWL